jgi:hypothetical protein
MNYGEMTPDSWSEVLKEIGPLGTDDLFFDLGCGRGTLVVQAALEVKMFFGVDLRSEQLSNSSHFILFTFSCFSLNSMSLSFFSAVKSMICSCFVLFFLSFVFFLGGVKYLS